MTHTPRKQQPPRPTPRIEAIDENLKVHREAWLDAPADKKVRWWKKINELIDERLAAMAERDGLAAH